MLFTLYSITLSLKCSSDQYSASLPSTATPQNTPAASPADTPSAGNAPSAADQQPPLGNSPITQSGSTGSKFTGDSTRYSASGQGACQTAISDNDLSVALNSPQYGNVGQKSEYCGKSVCVCGNDPAQADKECVTAVVSNACPECKQGDLDMTGATWKAVWPSHEGGSRFKISWSFGSC